MHPTLCENKASNSYKCTPLTSLSQPCMPVSNIGPTRILPFLYLGSHRDAMSQEIIQVNDISYILNVSINCPKPPFVKEGHFHRIPVNDNYSAKLLPFFQQAFQFIDKVREANGCVMVHCLAGISRSPTLAIAYVMKYLHMTSDDAYRYVKDKRPTISPNFNFLGQLLEYEKSLKQREEQLQNRQDSNGSIRDGKSAPIIMDLQICSPSSPIAKVGKPFAFDSHWFSRPTEFDIKSDTNDYIHSIADSVSSEKTASTYAEKHDSKIELVQEKCSHTTAFQFSPVLDNIPMTPSKEMPPFPFDCSIMQNPNEEEKQDLNVRKDYRRKSPTLSPKSPVNRSFTLALTPVSLQSNALHATSEQKRSLGSPMSESCDMIFPSSKSTGKEFIKQFNVPLSPVVSPATPENLESSEETQQLLRSKQKSLCSTPVSSTQEKDGKAKKVSRAFTLTLSSTNAPEYGGSETTQKKFKQEKNFTLPVSPLQQKNVMEVQSEFKSPTFKSRPFTLPISPVISSGRNTSTLDVILPSLTEAAAVMRSTSSIPLSTVKPQGSKMLLDLPTSSQEEVKPLFLSPLLKSQCENSSGKTNHDKSTIQMDVNLSDSCSKPINTEKMISECTPLSTDNREPPVTSLSLQSSHSSSAVTSFFSGSSNSKLKVHTSQNMYSPSAALAELHFSQAIMDNSVLAKPSSLQNFPSTSLDKLNFTPCFAKENKNQETECSIGNSSSDEVCQEQTLTVSSVCNSMCSSTVTSLSGNQVRLRTHDNRAKRPLTRPNSIAFSKYPTFDLGSDCQESSNSGSSASQDDSSETYLLQNRKRSKASHSDEKYSTTKYSERNMYQQITTALECNAMFRTQVYEASRKARSLDDILASGECESLKSQYSPFGKMVQRFGLGSERFTSPLYDSMTCHNSTDTYQSNSSISSNGSLHGSLEVIQPNFHFLNGINRKGRLNWFNSQRQEP